jgi:mono/diheme cytochrome c family protein
VLLVLSAAGLFGCQQRMATQPHVGPDEVSHFFTDGRSQRPLVAGTVARGHLRSDEHLYAARVGGEMNRPALSAALLGSGVNAHSALAVGLATEAMPPVDTFPFPVTADVFERGKQRFMIYCVVCHDPLGTGHGMIVQRGYTRPPSYHVPRLRAAPVGHFYEVITLGYGSMPAYRDQIPPRERWAIAAYLRALQLSQHFPEQELSASMREAWKTQKEAANGGTP